MVTIMGNTTKVRLAILGKKQVDVLSEVRKRGYANLEASQLNAYINERNTTPQAKAVMKIVDDVLDEWESKAI